VQPTKSSYQAPTTIAFVERFIQSIEHECLDRFVIFGEQHMDHVCREYLAHYHDERPHQSLRARADYCAEAARPPEDKAGQREG
jgi:hypothetical protein